jgi:hypothetical protein
MSKLAFITSALLLILAMPFSHAAAPRSLSVTVVGTDLNDPRWQAVEEAVEFWNGELANSGVALRLGPVKRLIQPVPDSALNQLSAYIGNIGAQPTPSELAQLPDDIIIALSVADFISFGMRWSDARKGLVALKRGRPHIDESKLRHYRWPQTADNWICIVIRGYIEIHWSLLY